MDIMVFVSPMLSQLLCEWIAQPHAGIEQDKPFAAAEDPSRAKRGLLLRSSYVLQQKQSRSWGLQNRAAPSGRLTAIDQLLSPADNNLGRYDMQQHLLIRSMAQSAEQSGPVLLQLPMAAAA